MDRAKELLQELVRQYTWAETFEVTVTPVGDGESVHVRVSGPRKAGE